MKKRLLVVDYRENGESKHYCLECGELGVLTDKDIIDACRVYVGVENILDGVIEVFTDMTTKELEKIILSEKACSLPMKVLYLNSEEVERFKKEMMH